MKRPASVRAAVAKSREARLRRVEAHLTRNLRYLWRHDRDGYEALVGMLRRAVAKQPSTHVRNRRHTEAA